MRDLLLQLCRYPYDEKNKEHLSELIDQVQDWDKIVKLINSHGIIALAAYNIKESGLENKIPSKSMALLENGYLQSVIRNTWLTKRWKEVNEILSNAGIKYILLKGMALEYTLYDSKGLRQMNDNDILLRKEDAVKAWNLLLQNGFKDGLKSPLHRRIIMNVGNHLPCLYKDGYALEIHYKLFDIKERIYNNIDPMESACEILIDGTKALILSRETHLKYLIDHFERHASGGSAQIRQYADIILLDKSTKTIMSESFILNPDQSNHIKYKKRVYKKIISPLNLKCRIIFIVGDIFPSLSWMKTRYRCNWLRALFLYPARLGKILWL